jgi:hypothetical protein
MGQSKGSSDESIGRPNPWREGRYQQPGKSVDRAVTPPPGGKEQAPDPISKPVTRKDYQQRSVQPIDRSLNQWNVGYAPH